MNTYWQKQTKDQPLFPDLLWSKPENKRLAGKLLIIGGNLHSVGAPSTAYNQAEKSGIGVAKVLLPDALRKTFGSILENCEFSPSTPSGSFNKNSLAEWLSFAEWADCVLLAGDIGRNSETAIITEQFTKKYSGPLVITQDCLDIFVKNPRAIVDRKETLIVGSFSQIQKLFQSERRTKQPLQYANSLVNNIEIIHDLSLDLPAYIATKQHDEIILACKGQISTTPNPNEIWRVSVATSMSVWWLQNPDKPFAALTTSLT